MAGGRGLVLVVEDDSTIAELVRRYLAREGYGVHVERDGVSALAQIRRLRPSVVLLDVGLPDLGGFEVCRRMRAAGDWTPVIFLTARDDESDRVLGLELGADDYVTKPFSPRELVGRITSVLRRATGPPPGATRSLGRVVVDPVRRTVLADGSPVELTATEFDLLAHLVASPGQVFSREHLLSQVWGHADYSGSRTVDVHVAQLRAKLGAASPIVTSRGVGYAARA